MQHILRSTVQTFINGTGYLTGNNGRSNFVTGKKHPYGHDRSNIYPREGRLFYRSWPVQYPAFIWADIWPVIALNSLSH